MHTVKPIYAAKFMRPRLAKHVIQRPAIIDKIKQAVNYPLTVVRAGAGYGKSTAISMAFPEYVHRTAWLNLSEQERDGQLFLSQLLQALSNIVPDIDNIMLPFMHPDERKHDLSYSTVIAALAEELRRLVHEDLMIVLEDYHFIGNDSPVIALTEEFTALLPNTVHLVVSVREKLPFSQLPLWQARDEALIIDQEDLAFSSDEIQQLFQEKYQFSLSRDAAEMLAKRTEGWIMAIQMIARNNRNGFAANSIAKLPTAISELFEFLLEEYLATEPEMVRNFLRYTAHLELLQTDDCDHILGITNSKAILRSLESKGLFTFWVSGNIYRYHQLFQEYLMSHLTISPKRLMAFHNKAAGYYWENGLQTLAVDHFLHGKFYTKATELIRLIYRAEFSAGRHKQVDKWLQMYPADILNQYADLILCQGELRRLTGDYSEALRLYEAASREFSRIQDIGGLYLTHKAMALVYLDTVQPVMAEQCLNQALRYADGLSGDELKNLMRLIAENNINLGKAHKAAELLEEAGISNYQGRRTDVQARMYLRTGRLSKAKSLLNRQEYPVEPNNLRDTPLLLALINAFLGAADEAWLNAQAGLSSAIRFNRFFIQAMAYMRLGHAKQIQPWADFDEIEGYYQQSLELISQMGIERIKAEALMGLCLLYGHNGHLEAAVRYGTEGILVAERVKDDWTAALLRVCMAIIGVINKAPQTEQWLSEAHEAANYCDDRFLQVLVLFWQTKFCVDNGSVPIATLHTLLELAQEYGYDFIFYRTSFFGLRDVQSATPILSAAMQAGIASEYAATLLGQIGSGTAITSHPGYTLRIQTLGAFKVWRGLSEITAWPRENAKRLLQYLATNRKKFTHKEEIIVDLFGDRFTDTDFKVAMNALISTLEPGRTVRSNPYYIIRHRAATGKHRSLYGLNPASGTIVDADEFENLIQRGNGIVNQDGDKALALYRLALEKYRGDFLMETAYEDWATSERQRLLMLYMTTAEKAAGMLYQRNRHHECLELCIKILNKDPLWESAYGLAMQAYAKLGNRSLAIKTFQQCKQCLRDELGIDPCRELTDLYVKIIDGRTN